MQYVVYFLVLHSSHWAKRERERERWLLYIITLHFFFVPRGSLGCSAVCDCGITGSYSLFDRIEKIIHIRL